MLTSIKMTLFGSLVITLMVLAGIMIPITYAEETNLQSITLSVLQTSSDTSVEEKDDDIKPGTIIVTSPSTTETTVYGLSSDGKVRVEITANNPIAGKPMSIDIKFRDSSGALKKNANYDMLVTQNDKEILSINKSNEPDGNGTYTTIPLDSDGQVDFKITLLGFGMPNDEMNWSGPKGEMLRFNIVPEFGTIALMILGISIVSVIISSKSKNLISLRI